MHKKMSKIQSDFDKKVQSFADGIDDFLRKKANLIIEEYPNKVRDSRTICLAILCDILAGHAVEMMQMPKVHLHLKNIEEFCEKVTECIITASKNYESEEQF